MMNKYEVTLTGHYEKTITVTAKTPAHAREKIETVLFDTDLIDFSDEDFIGGEATINVPVNDDCDEIDESFEDDCCLECEYFCPACGSCMCEDDE